MTLSDLNVFFSFYCYLKIVFFLSNILVFLTSERLMRVLCYIMLTLKKKLTYFLSCIYVSMNFVL